MDKLVKITIFLTALSTTVFSSPPQILYEKVISSDENIVHVEPILDSLDELSGFIYTESSQNKIIIESFDSDTTIEIGVPIFPIRSIVRYSELKDTLYIYTLTIEMLSKPKITLTILDHQTYTQQTITAETYSGYSGFPHSTHTFEYLDFSFYPNNRNSQQVIFEFCYRVDDYIVTMGPESYNVSTSLIYSLDLAETIVRSPQSSIKPAYLFSDETMNYVYGEKFYYSYNFSGIDDQDNYGATSFQQVTIVDEIDNYNSQLTTPYDEIYSIHIDNFAPTSLTDELIIHADSEDLLGYYNKTNHIACYAFTDVSPIELWYNDDIANIDFSYVYKAKDLLIGRQGTDKIIMLNYLNGQITDSSLLNSSLENQRFFETGIGQPLLNVVGMSGDTVIAYRFDISTNVHEPNLTQDIPKTFTLFQNHPNPFNGETRLEFSTTENQTLKLSIYNILGQDIKILASTKFAPGVYSYYWDGSDENGLTQSTGIYFARLESETTSQMIKLIYLK